ncbi:hypothetical protein [Boudabousia tangfeifanii]|uniref:hypothetical protein n=1 Tax=Boudabousia tangfeifanii TaxID=1912795 RepID=UPI0009F626E5|nr:hypothetical protein [Boudabousia tangfeifanii]
MKRRPYLVDLLVLAWLVAVVVAVLVSGSSWLILHLAALGVISQAILYWAEHFTYTLNRVPIRDKALRWQQIKTGSWAILATLVLAGVVHSLPWPTALGATGLAILAAWQAWELTRVRRRSLMGRFPIVVRYYATAALLLPWGLAQGTWLAIGGQPKAPLWWQASLQHGMDESLRLGHSLTNILGWVAFTVLGTLLTFWPTMLRAQMDPKSTQHTISAWWWLLGGILVINVGAYTTRAVLLAGLAIYAIGLIWWGYGLVAPLRAKTPSEFAPLSALISLVWFALGYLYLVWTLATDTQALSLQYPRLGLVWGLGFGAQLVWAALSYLLPTTRSRGPAMAKEMLAIVNAAGVFRLTVWNLSLAALVAIWLGALAVSPWWFLAPLLGVGAANLTALGAVLWKGKA